MHDDLALAGFDAFEQPPTRRDELDVLAAFEIRERRLTAGLAVLANRSSSGDVTAYAGWTAGKLPRRLFYALRKALPFPRTLQGALAERKEWLWLVHSRRASGRLRYLQPVHIRARLAALEMLLSQMPDPTVDGIRARLDWISISVEGALMDAHGTLVVTETLRKDFEALLKHASRLIPAVEGEEALKICQQSKRSNAEKQTSVVDLLKAEPRLPDREIARRCGVSAPMVGSWRRRREARQSIERPD